MTNICRLKNVLVDTWKSSSTWKSTLHILVHHENVVGWQLVFIYMKTPPTLYYLEYSGEWPT